ncbi:MAG: cation-translocating P-type ATPase [Acidimicrobiales bacterium]
MSVAPRRDGAPSHGAEASNVHSTLTEAARALKDAWGLDATQIATVLDVDLERGLTTFEAARRLAELGSNQLTRARVSSPLVLLARQFTNAMVLVLTVAGVVTALTGEVADTIVIGAIVLLNGVVGFVQEYRAQRALEALRLLEGDEVVVLRDGAPSRIPATEVVLGDVVQLATGDLVPADLRVLKAHNLRIAQAALTGESEPALKSIEPLRGRDQPVLGDRRNMAFQGTAVTFGRGTGVVVAVGGATELGLIADLLAARTEVPTPLQSRLTSLARLMAVGAVGVCGAIFIIGMIRGEPLREMFVTSVSLAVAAIPEGLPAIITVALALGARRMAERRALIRRLVAVETLGSVDVICTDKTGTLTQNRMQVVRVWTPLGEYLVAGNGYSPEGDIVGPRDPSSDPYLERVAVVAALCNDASLRAPAHANGAWELSGDPTEGALVALAGKCGIDAASLRQSRARVEELPFDADRRRMTTLHRSDGVIRS